MPVVRNLMVRAGADFSAITKQANKAKASMSGMQASVSRSCSRMTTAVSGLNKVFGAIGVSLSVAAIVSFSKNAKEAYDEQSEASAKLAQVMKNTMGARADEVKSIEDLIDAQERLGIVDGAIQTEAAQELATYLTMSDSLKTLIPVINDMVAQQYGFGASAESAASIATMLGKVMNGQTSALSRYGYTFTKAQEEILKYGTEAQRAAVLAEVVGQSVGGMNAALAATPNGRMQQLNFTMEQIKETFGQAVSNISVLFIPALNTACSVLASMATLANKVAQALSNVFGSGGSAAASAVAYTAAAASGMNDLAEETKAAETAAQDLGSYGFDTLQKMSGGVTSEADADSDTGTSGAITETASGADEAGESIGWLERAMTRLKDTAADLNFDALSRSLGRLKEAVSPLTEGLFSGLSWGYNNVLVPLAKWTVGDAAPAFLHLLAGAASVLSAPLTALQPMGDWLWTNFLVPIAGWTGGVIVTVLEGLATALQGVSNWIAQNQGLVQGMTVIAAAFCAAWQVATIGEFIINAGGVAGVLGRVTSALYAGIAAKIADKAATLGICAIYVKDWAVALAGNVVAVGKDVAAWIALRAEWIAGKAALVASTVAQAAHTAASWAGTAATTALGVAMNVLCSPITLVIAAIAALVAGIILLVKNWDTVKAAAVTVWENIKSVWSSAGTWFSTKVIEPISNGFRNFANGIIGFFEGMVNGAIGGINKIISGFNKISFTVPDWVPVIGGKAWGFNLGLVPSATLPRLAEGAVFEGNDPYMAIVNDQKHGVNVESPLSTIVEAMMTALQSVNFNDDIQVNVRAVFDGQLAALARLMRPYFEADARRVGTKASSAKAVV